MLEALERLKRLQREVQYLSHAAAVLGWDQETYMPPHAVEERAEQIAVLEGLVHDRCAAPEVGDLLARLGASDEQPAGSACLGIVESALVRETWRSYRRAVRLPRDLVRALARQASLAQHLWAAARKQSRFDLFRDALAETLKLTVEKAEALGYTAHRYDPLLDEHEPWTTTDEVASVLSALEPRLRTLAARATAAGRRPDGLSGTFPALRQRELSDRVMADLGFDMARGRLDVSAHPFSTTLGRRDVRVTTRFDEGNLTSGLLSTVHECGHGLYEQGLDEDLDGTILAAGTSLGIHESQSRFWENIVGRSAAFWRRYLPVAIRLFPDALSGVTVERITGAVNRVEPSLIRVDADEVTYNLHIILRFELETRLVAGDLAVADLPDAWAQASLRLLGVAPRRDADGVLQDIHWSMGAIGYFPAYCLGNLYAAQFRAAMCRDLGDLDALIDSGEFATVLGWLRERIHRHGRVYPAGQLCRRVTGSALDPAVFLDYLETKFEALHGL